MMSLRPHGKVVLEVLTETKLYKVVRVENGLYLHESDAGESNRGSSEGEELIAKQRTHIHKLLQVEYEQNVLAISSLRLEYDTNAAFCEKSPEHFFRPIAFLSTHIPTIVLEDKGTMSLERYCHQAVVDLPLLIHIAISMCEALHSLHSAGLIHNRVNCCNVHIHPHTGAIYLMDFGGVMHWREEDSHRSERRVLSDEQYSDYLSPEQTGRLDKMVDFRSDLYSLGCLLYWLWVGLTPFGLRKDVEYAHVAVVPIRLDQINTSFPETSDSTVLHLRDLQLEPASFLYNCKKTARFADILDSTLHRFAQCRTQRLMPTVPANIIAKLLVKDSEDRYQSAYGLKEDWKEYATLIENSIEKSEGRRQKRGKMNLRKHLLEVQSIELSLGRYDHCPFLRLPQTKFGIEKYLRDMTKLYQLVKSQKRNGVMHIVGRSGCGKTSLTTEFLKRIQYDEKEQCPIIARSKHGLDKERNNNALWEVLEDVLRQCLWIVAPDEVRKYLLKQLTPTTLSRLAALMPTLQGLLESDGNQIVREEGEELGDVEQLEGYLIVGLEVLLAMPRGGAMGRRGGTKSNSPVILSFDDVQWANKSSLLFLRRLLSGSSLILLILSYVPGERDRHLDDFLNSSFSSSAFAHLRVSLGGLDTISLKQMVLYMLDESGRRPIRPRDGKISRNEEERERSLQTLYDFTLRRTGGNPLFVRSLLIHLYKADILRFAFSSQSWHFDLARAEELEMSKSVADILLDELNRLGESDRQVLAKAAWIGHTFDVQTLSRVAGISLTDTVNVCARGIQLGYLQEASGALPSRRIPQNPSEGEKNSRQTTSNGVDVHPLSLVETSSTHLPGPKVSLPTPLFGVKPSPLYQTFSSQETMTTVQAIPNKQLRHRVASTRSTPVIAQASFLSASVPSASVSTASVASHVLGEGRRSNEETLGKKESRSTSREMLARRNSNDSASSIALTRLASPSQLIWDSLRENAELGSADEVAMMTVSFTHDRVHEAFIKFVEEDGKALHLKIGRVLKEESSTLVQLYIAVPHLNEGSDLMDEAERRELALYNVTVAEYALRTSAYDRCRNFCEKGVELLRSIGVTLANSEHPDRPHLTRLYTYLFKIYHVMGQAENGIQLFDLLMQHNITLREQLSIGRACVKMLSDTGKFNDALRIGRMLARKLGYDISVDVTREDVLVLRDEIKSKASREEDGIHCILRRPRVDLEKEEHYSLSTAATIFVDLTDCAYLMGDYWLYCWLIYKVITMSFEYVSTASISALGISIVAMSIVHGRPCPLEVECSHCALQLADSLPSGVESDECMPLTYLSITISTIFWGNKVVCEKYFEKAMLMAKVNNDLAYARYTLSVGSCALFIHGMNLKHLLIAVSSHFVFLRKSSATHPRRLEGVLGPYVEFSRLVLPSEDKLLEGIALEQAPREPKDLSFFSSWRYLARLVVNCVLNEQEEMRDSLEMVYLHSDKNSGSPMSYETHFWIVLATLKQLEYRGLSPAEAEEWLLDPKLVQRLEKFKEFHQSRAAGAHGHLNLLEAHFANLRGESGKALEYCEQALQCSEDGEHSHIGAMAAELAFELASRMRLRNAAQGYMSIAVGKYRLWGAARKVQSLSNGIPASSPSSTKEAQGSTSSSSLLDSQAKDFVCAVLGETTRLLNSEGSAMKIVHTFSLFLLKYAGAQRGWFVLSREEGGNRALYAVSRWDASRDTVLLYPFPHSGGDCDSKERRDSSSSDEGGKGWEKSGAGGKYGSEYSFSALSTLFDTNVSGKERRSRSHMEDPLSTPPPPLRRNSSTASIISPVFSPSNPTSPVCASVPFISSDFQQINTQSTSSPARPRSSSNLQLTTSADPWQFERSGISGNATDDSEYNLKRTASAMEHSFRDSPELHSVIHDDEKVSPPFQLPQSQSPLRVQSLKGELPVEALMHVCYTGEIVSDFSRFRDSCLHDNNASKLCLPMISMGECIGAVYMENDAVRGGFSERLLVLLQHLLSQIAASLQRVEMRDNLMHTMERMKMMNDELLRMGRVQDDFVANTSHELRTPLNAMLGTLSLIKDTPLSEEQVELLELMSYSTKSLLAVINDVLDFQKCKEERLSLKLKPFDLVQTLNDLISCITCTASLSKKVEVSLLVDTELYKYNKCLGDTHRLQQILLNLLSNAAKFTKEGDIILQVDVIPLPKRNILINRKLRKMFEEGLQNSPASEMVCIEFTIRDTGVGIAPIMQSKIFQPFAQVDGSSTRVQEGTGLGLSISNLLVQLMSSKTNMIHLSSDVGKGSSFSFQIALPFFLPKSETPNDYQQAASMLAGSAFFVVSENTITRHAVCKEAHLVKDASIDVFHSAVEFNKFLSTANSLSSSNSSPLRSPSAQILRSSMTSPSVAGNVDQVGSNDLQRIFSNSPVNFMDTKRTAFVILSTNELSPQEFSNSDYMHTVSEALRQENGISLVLLCPVAYRKQFKDLLVSVEPSNGRWHLVVRPLLSRTILTACLKAAKGCATLLTRSAKEKAKSGSRESFSQEDNNAAMRLQEEDEEEEKSSSPLRRTRSAPVDEQATSHILTHPHSKKRGQLLLPPPPVFQLTHNITSMPQQPRDAFSSLAVPNEDVEPLGGDMFPPSMTLRSAEKLMLVKKDKKSRKKMGNGGLKGRILMVEDNLVNQTVQSRLVGKIGYSCECASNGQIGLEVYCREQPTNPFDFIVMDCHMPLMDGFLCTSKIREFERETGLPHCHVIALTATSYGTETIEKCSVAGMCETVFKPVNVKSLDMALKKLKSHGCEVAPSTAGEGEGKEKEDQEEKEKGKDGRVKGKGKGKRKGVTQIEKEDQVL